MFLSWFQTTGDLVIEGHFKIAWWFAAEFCTRRPHVCVRISSA